MDINQVITLGIGTPSDIAHFILVGLSPGSSAAASPSRITLDGSYGLVVEVDGSYAGTITVDGSVS